MKKALFLTFLITTITSSQATDYQCQQFIHAWAPTFGILDAHKEYVKNGGDKIKAKCALNGVEVSETLTTYKSQCLGFYEDLNEIYIKRYTKGMESFTERLIEECQDL
jgi:hypothetical protein